MKLIIAGGRDYHLNAEDEDWLDCLNSALGIHVVIEGGAKGADAGGKLWAQSRGIPVVTVPAEWTKRGRAAGPIRNAKMAKLADAVALFPGGVGTDSMRKIAKKAGLRIFEHLQIDPT